MWFVGMEWKSYDLVYSNDIQFEGRVVSLFGYVIFYGIFCVFWSFCNGI